MGPPQRYCEVLMHLSLRWLGLTAVLVAAQAQAQFSGLVAFGDSLSDMGNVNQITLGASPGPNYFQGRFSNGPVWIERVATSYSLPISRSLAGGNNFAYGGARSGTGFTNFIIPNMSNQVASYLTSFTPSSTTLYSLWIGGNDYLNGQTDVNVVVNNIANDVTSLYNAGGRFFVVPNLPLLGNIPQNIGTANQAPANFISNAHNQALAARMQQLRSLSGITIYSVDVASFFNSVQTNPGSFGLTNVTQPALLNGSVVSDVDQYLFFDNIHPTRVGHQLLAEYTLQSIPEPMTMTVLALGAVAALRRRRNR